MKRGLRPAELRRGIAIGRVPPVSIDWLPVLALEKEERRESGASASLRPVETALV